MNCDQAKALSIVDFLNRIGHAPTKTSGHDVWYLSPRREEETASFHVHTGKNVWCDQGDGIGGTIIDLAIEILKSHGKPCTVSDALDWIENTDQIGPGLNIVSVENYIEDEPTLQLSKVCKIQHPALKNYLHSRGIPVPVAALNMKEAKVYNRATKKHFFALAMKNEDGGYELRNEFFKGCVGPKDITFIRGTNPSGIHLFEGKFDYETILTINKGHLFRDDTIILHSVSNVSRAIPFIKNYDYKFALTWMDNDKAGRKARRFLHEFCKTENGLLHKPMNKIYMSHKDLNAWHMGKLGL